MSDLKEIANEQYYNTGSPILTDEEFNLISDHGLETRNFRNKANHHSPMGSLKKIKTEDDFYKWAKDNTVFKVTPKLDGNSIEVILNKNGNIIQCITRGNGCLDKNTLVEFECGNIDTISNIVENKKEGKVKSYNHLTNNVEYKEITNWFINDNDNEWFELELDNGKILKLTGNHQVWSVDKQKYIQVKYLNVDESVFLNDK